MNQAHTSRTYPGGAQPWVVIFCAALFFFFEFMQMNMFNAINPSLMRSFHISAEGLGHLSSLYFTANVLFLFPAGLLLDRFSTHKLILLAFALCVISTYGFALASNLIIAGVFRFLTGIGSTFCMLSSVRLATRWFPPKRLALVIGLVVTIAMAGGMMAQTPLTYLVEHFSWRHAIMANATIGIAFMLLIGIFVQDFPQGNQQEEIKQTQYLQEIGFWRSILMAAKNRQNWLSGIYTNLMSLPIVVLGAIWGGMYLMQVYHLTAIQTSYVTTMIFLGVIIGSPVFGYLSDRIGRRIAPMLVGAICCLIILLLLMYLTHLNLYSLMLLFFLLGFFCGAQIITYALLAESNPRSLTATAEGIACTIIMAAGTIFQPLFGAIMDHHWQGKITDGIRQYPVPAYHAALWSLAIAFMISIVITFCLRESYCKHLGDN